MARNHINHDDLDRLAREEDQRVLASWQRISNERTITKNFASDTWQTRTARDER